MFGTLSLTMLVKLGAFCIKTVGNDDIMKIPAACRSSRSWALSLVVVSGVFSPSVLWAAALFDASATADYTVTTNPSGLTVSVFDSFWGPPVTGAIGNASASGTGGTSPLQVAATGTALGLPASPPSTAFASNGAVLSLDIENGGTAAGDLSVDIDWSWAASVSADPLREIAQVGVSLEVIVFDGISAVSSFPISEFLDTGVGDTAGSNSGVFPLSLTVPSGELWNVDLFLDIVDGFAESSYERVPAPSTLALFTIGLGLLGLRRSRVETTRG